MEPTALHTRDALIAAAAGDPYLAHDAALPPGGTAYVWGSAVATCTAAQPGVRRPPTVRVLGPDDAPAAELLRWTAREQPWGRPAAVSVERHREPDLHALYRVAGGNDWDWLWTTAAPPDVPGEDALADLDDTADAPAVLALNEVANPTAESQPGTGRSVCWRGRWEDRRLVAAGALHLTDSGTGVLTGIAVHPDARGRGLGAAVTASLTRVSLERTGAATLGMYADNDVARRLYTRLGYAVAHRWASRLVRPL